MAVAVELKFKGTPGRHTEITQTQLGIQGAIVKSGVWRG
jgi:hypothetical protein